MDSPRRTAKRFRSSWAFWTNIQPTANGTGAGCSGKALAITMGKTHTVPYGWFCPFGTRTAKPVPCNTSFPKRAVCRCLNPTALATSLRESDGSGRRAQSNILRPCIGFMSRKWTARYGSPPLHRRKRNAQVSIRATICLNDQRPPIPYIGNGRPSVYFFLADTISIIGRRSASFMPAIESMWAGGCGSTTCRSSKPFSSSPLR